jgi:ATP synthase protein I
VLLSSKPVRTVLGWQLTVTAATALVAAPFAGFEGAISAVLGGLVNGVAGIVYFAVAGFGWSKSSPLSAWDALRNAFRAEASKVLVTIVGLWIVLTAFKGIGFVPFFVAFMITAFLPGVALMVRDQPPSR